MSYRILIVDDSPAMRVFVRRIIEISGVKMFDCLEASNGCEALELLGGGRVDMILTDVNMPLMDGEELLRQLQLSEAWRNIPVIVISADSTCKRMERMLALGACGYISKPFSPETVRYELELNLGAACE